MIGSGHILPWCWLACLLIGAAVQAAEIRYPEVAYLDELGVSPLQLKVRQRTSLSMSRDLSRSIAFLAKGQPVTLVGWAEQMYYVDTRISTGRARGWVRADAIEAPTEKFLKELRFHQERRERHRALIARQEIAIGMNRAEVEESLGKPDRKQTLQTPDGLVEHWMYITYRYVPHYDRQSDDRGRLRQTVTYRRVPTGHRIVQFVGAEVATIEEDREEKPQPRPPIVVPPLEILR